MLDGSRFNECSIIMYVCALVLACVRAHAKLGVNCQCVSTAQVLLFSITITAILY